MDSFLGEHGDVLIYGVIGLTVVLLISFICENKWKDMTPDYKRMVSKNSEGFRKQNKDKYPIIEVDEIIYAEYQTENFNCRDFIKAKDYLGRDISDDVRIYGKIDTFRRGIYQLRCVVMSENQLASTKYINVIVE